MTNWGPEKNLEQVSRITRLLEPLVVLYERTVQASGKNPSEVWLQIQQTTYEPRDQDEPFGTVHFIDGETLQAVFEIWQHYRQIEIGLREAQE